jgi:hypothetical protein
MLSAGSLVRISGLKLSQQCVLQSDAAPLSAALSPGTTAASPLCYSERPLLQPLKRHVEAGAFLCASLSRLISLVK